MARAVIWPCASAASLIDAVSGDLACRLPRRRRAYNQLDSDSSPSTYVASKSRLLGDACLGDERRVSVGFDSVRHEVYSALLDALSLSPAHDENLQGRGLTKDEIERRGYRSLPRGGRDRIADDLHATHGDDVLGVPGIARRERNGLKYFTIAGAEGLLIPVRDADGRIIAIKIRRDGNIDGSRYAYLSSTRYGGPGPGSPAHVPVGISAPAPTVRLTEGELKADIASVLTSVPTISVPGVGNWRVAIEPLKRLKCTTVILAMDMDATTKIHVAAARGCAESLRPADRAQMEAGNCRRQGN